MSIPIVFVSYSHDSQPHKKWVLDLATRLRNSGVDAIIDQWELKPGDDLPKFMEENLAKCDFALMICTEKYVEKANAGIGGVGYEKMIITSDLLKQIDSSKVIPIIRQSGGYEVPTFLKTKLFIDFSKEDDYEFSFDELIRTLQNAPLYKKPEIGNNPFEEVESVPLEKSGDPLRELMLVLIKDYEAGNEYTVRSQTREKLGMSRIMFDVLAEEALEKGLIVKDRDGDLFLTSKGKFYAVEHKLI